MIKNLTILELQKAERYSEAGYGRLFAYQSLHFNAMIDARTKAKFIRQLNPETHEETQKEILYSGPTVFFDETVDIIDQMIDKLDIRSAYPSYLINEQISKPGMYRMKHDGAFPLSDWIALYIIKFNCSVDNLFAKWFLNSSAITKQKIKTDGSRIWGSVGIFSSTWMNLTKYVNKYLAPEEGLITKTYTFHGDQVMDIKQSQIRKLYEDKEDGSKESKMMLVQSTGWLSLIDRPTYYHMVQYIKFYLLETIYNHKLEDDLIGVQTDCLFYRVTEQNDNIFRYIKNMSLSGKKSSIGTYSFKRVPSDDIITNRARVVLKNG